MKRFFAVCAAMLSASCHAGPTNAQMNELWLFSTYFVCLAQDSRYESSQFAAMFAKAPDFKGWEAFRSSPRAQCFGARQWISKSLCDEVVATLGQEEHGLRLKRLLTEHQQEVVEIEPVVQLYFQPTNVSGPFNCPAERPAK